MARTVTSAFVILGMITLLVPSRGEDKVESSSGVTRNILFTKVGRASLKSSFAHLVLPLRLDRLRSSFDELDDATSAFNKLATHYDGAFESRQAELNRIRSRIDILSHLAVKATENAHFDAHDTENELLTSMIMQLGPENGNAWKPKLDQPTTGNNTTTGTSPTNGLGGAQSGRRRRNVESAIVSSVISLGAFALNLFSRREIAQIYETAKSADRNSGYVVEMAEANSLRINNLTLYTEAMENALNTTVFTVSRLQDKQHKDTIRDEVEKLLRIFTSELHLFLMGVQSLQDGRLSPLLVNPDDIQEDFRDLITLSGSEGFQPVVDDVNLIYQAQTSTVGINGDLVCIVHVPLYSGHIMDLYKVVKAPFFLTEGVVATIGYGKSFLALSSSGAMGKELTENEVKDCRVYNGIFHCTANDNVVRKDLQNLCLYALFHQRHSDIERLCKVEVSDLTSHAIQLDGDTFRLLATKPTQLTWSCGEGGGKVDFIQGIYLLKLNETCRSAHTADHVFYRNPTIMAASSVISLPSINSTDWTKNFKNEFNPIDLKEQLVEIRKSRPGPVPLAALKNRLEYKNTRTFHFYFTYVQYVTTFLVVFIVIRYLIGWMRLIPARTRCRAKFRRSQTQTPSAKEFELRENLMRPSRQDWETTRANIIKKYATKVPAVEIV